MIVEDGDVDFRKAVDRKCLDCDAGTIDERAHVLDVLYTNSSVAGASFHHETRGEMRGFGDNDPDAGIAPAM
jgi:hypothetical protein